MDKIRRIHRAGREAAAGRYSLGIFTGEAIDPKWRLRRILALLVRRCRWCAAGAPLRDFHTGDPSRSRWLDRHGVGRQAVLKAVTAPDALEPRSAPPDLLQASARRASGGRRCPAAPAHGQCSSCSWPNAAAPATMRPCRTVGRGTTGRTTAASRRRGLRDLMVAVRQSSQHLDRLVAGAARHLARSSGQQPAGCPPLRACRSGSCRCGWRNH